jgi:PAS domain S-box-containing protein
VTDLRLAEEALRRSRDELEQQVGERTAQLVRSNADLRQQVKEREQAEARYRTLVELAPMSIMIHTEGRIVFMNTFAAKAFGARSPEEFFGSSVFDLMDPHLRELSAQRIEWMLKEWQPAPVIEMSGQRVGGSPGWAEIHSAPILYDGHPSIMVIGIDVTERRAADDRLRASLREKEILLREVHHRVKNNLQLMSSLLSLQGMHSDCRDAQTVLRQAESRVWSIALAHETLYRSQNVSEISSVDYLGTLIGTVLEGCSADGSKVSIITDLEDGALKIDYAINCGMILNELVTNSLKHAFPGELAGELAIALKFGEQDSVHLSVADNGVGIPPNIDIASAESFGLDLVKTLVEEMKGNIELNRAHGSELRIKFRQA